MEKESLKAKAYNYLLNAITTGKLKQGDIINRRSIAAELGISVSPVAMFQLQNEGLLQVLKNKGTRVKIIEFDDVIDLYIVRIAIECQAARIYGGSIIKNNYKELKKLAEKTDKTRAPSREHINAEIDFHRALVNLSGSKGLLSIFDSVIKQGMFRVTLLNRFRPSNLSSSHRHMELLASLTVDNSDKAEKFIRDHLTKNDTLFHSNELADL